VIDAAQSAQAMQNEIRARVEPMLKRLSPSGR
jgi:hypothetical protein